MNALFGLWHKCPDDVEFAWGARAIVEQYAVKERRGRSTHIKHKHRVSLVYDRQSWRGDPTTSEGAGKFKSVLDRHLRDALETACEMFDSGELGMHSSKLVTLCEGDITIKANPNASGGYLYLIAY